MSEETISMPRPSAVLTDRWRMVGASVRGSSHEKSGQVCQDAHESALLPGGILVAAVADGAGSAAHSDLGAQIAARTAVAALCADETLSPQTMEAEAWMRMLIDALRIAQFHVQAEADAREIDVQTLASTLLVVVATPTLVAAAQIGDGAIVVGDDEGRTYTLTAPQNGEYVNTTVFLTTPNALDMAEIVVSPDPVTHLAIFSDGLQRCALRLPDASPYAPFFAPLFRFVTEESDPAEAEAQLTSFLQSPRVMERTDDDVTLILAAYVR